MKVPVLRIEVFGNFPGKAELPIGPSNQFLFAARQKKNFIKAEPMDEYSQINKLFVRSEYQVLPASIENSHL
jgi:hypothetical protein